MASLTSLPAVKLLPRAVSALVLHSSADLVLAASEDRSLRTFSLKDGRPVAAIVNLPDEVAVMVVDLSYEQPSSRDSDDSLGSVWVACGGNAYQLSLSAGPFLRTFQSALVRTIALCKVELNDLALSPDGKQLAWCGDDGRVGLLDLKTESKTWMKGKHANISGTVSFLPHHASTLFTTGYDTFARTWSSSVGSTIDTLALDPPPGSSSSMAPTFPISFDSAPFSKTDSLVAIGTADGAVWLSLPDLGIKSGKGKKKKAGGAWRQLDRLGRFEIEGEGAMNSVVGVALIPRKASPTSGESTAAPPSLESYPLVLTLSHTGALLLSRLQSSATSPPAYSLKKMSSWHTVGVAKCNALVASKEGKEGKVVVVVGGIGKAGQGVVESWQLVLE